ncbi:Rtr1/RPAP2 family-domain-containing protein [Geopyxis carbonaria]|nr:Rtr1/RPAP2 family-domain-containing protein [Geopyxis carbonaria]
MDAVSISSILDPSAAPSPKPKRTPSEARAIALAHASNLQIRKALEASVLSNLEALLDLPTTTTPLPTIATTMARTGIHPASRPCADDVAALKFRLRHFSPADYDDLLEERTINAQCGYALCPLPPRALPRGTGRVVAVDAARRFVERRKMERFCTPECARRALWLRVQLPTEPAWAREDVTAGARVDGGGKVWGVELGVEVPQGWTAGGEVVLLEEVESGGGGRGAREADVRRLKEELREMGVKGGALEVVVREKQAGPGEGVAPPTLGEGEEGAGRIEGFRVKE